MISAGTALAWNDVVASFAHAGAAHRARLFMLAVDGYRDDARAAKLALTHPLCPRQVLAAAAERFEGSPELVQLMIAIAWHKATPQSVLVRLTQHENMHVRYAIACNPASRNRTLTLLEHDKEYGVRYHVAEHPHAGPRLLQRLLKDKNSEVADAALRNPNTPLKARLAALGQRFDNDVTRAAAANPDTPAELLERWAKLDTSGIMRRVIASNPSAPTELLEPWAMQLVPESDRLDSLQNAVARNPRLSAPMATLLSSPAYSTYTRGALAANPALPGHVSIALAVDPSPAVRRKAVTYQALPASVLSQLIDEETEGSVLGAIFQHQDLSSQVIARYLDTADTLHPAIRQALAYRTWTVEDTLYIREHEFDHMLENCKPDQRVALFASAVAPVESMWKAVRSRKSVDKVGVALNPQAPKELLQRLARSSETLIAALAAAHPKLR
jgi:hypothetical protein